MLRLTYTCDRRASSASLVAPELGASADAGDTTRLRDAAAYARHLTTQSCQESYHLYVLAFLELGSKLLHIVTVGQLRVEAEALGDRAGGQFFPPPRDIDVREMKMNLGVVRRRRGGFARSFSASAWLPSRWWIHPSVSVTDAAPFEAIRVLRKRQRLRGAFL